MISDIVDAVTLLIRGNAALPEPVEHRCPRCPPERCNSRYYLRLDVKDESGVLAKISAATAKFDVSIASVQQTVSSRRNAATLMLTTHTTNEKAIRSAVAQLRRLAGVLGAPQLLRIASFDD